jgi:pyruvate/2-oxoglutarate dehydrogenase complex dihydrolipoamide acyltransferase (E2) component
MPVPQHTPRVNNNDDVVRLTRVHVKAGDAVNAGDLVAEVETEKTSYTVEAEQSGFVLAVVPEIDAMVEVGSVLLWIGAAPDEPIPAAPEAVASAPSVAEPTVKAVQLLAKYGLRASQVPASGARLSAKDVEDYVSHGGIRPQAAGTRRPQAAGARAADAVEAAWNPDVAGTFEELSTNERGMMRTVLWQRQHAVPGYVELQYDASAWDRAAADYQNQERLLMNPLLGLMAFRLVNVVKRHRRLNATMLGERRLVYDTINVGFTVQSDTTLYLAVVRNAGNMTCREFIDRLSQLQRSAIAHRLRGEESSGATVAFTSMSRWNVTRHIPVLPPHTALTIAHAAPSSDGRSILGATYDHRVLTGFDALSALAEITRVEAAA